MNIGLSYLFQKEDFLPFSFSYGNETRVGKTFIEFSDETQFENDVMKYVELANQYVLRYREFRDIQYAKDYMMNNLDDDNCNSYYKAMFCFLTDDIEQGQKYYQIYLDKTFYKRIVTGQDHPTNSEVLNKNHVLDMIKNQRQFWHTKPTMKKMKYDAEWE